MRGWIGHCEFVYDRKIYTNKKEDTDQDTEKRRKVNIIRGSFHKFYDPNNKYSRENRTKNRQENFPRKKLEKISQN